ncbi:MAG: GGDEF domain-containing protein [Clostridiales bacterium]|nr:GGDEF domain-containing protein [Clostridiales bacterium]
MLWNKLVQNYNRINKREFMLILLLFAILIFIESMNLLTTIGDAMIGAILYMLSIFTAYRFGYLGIFVSVSLNLAGIIKLFLVYQDRLKVHYLFTITYMISTIIASIIIGHFIEKNILFKQLLIDKSNTDHLTQLNNFSSFKSNFTNEIELSKIKNTKLGLMILDIDNFKQINDQYGHHIGDSVLKKIADNIADSTRENDKAFRYGGDEFAIIINESTKEICKNIYDRIQKQTPLTILDDGRELNFDISLSAGYAEYPSNGKDETDLFKSADSALYKIKNKYKNDIEYA